MAARLTVVVSQSANRGNGAADLEESLIAAVMMAPGMDATMIGALEHVQADGTDRLCLASFNHSFALVTWLDASEVETHWRRLELEGQIQGNTPLGADVRKRILHVQVKPETTVDQLLERLQAMLTDRGVKTVSIGLAGQPAKAQSPAPNEQQKTSQAGPGVSPATPPLTPPAVEKTDARGKPMTPVVAPEPSTDDQEYAHLDQLVDDFEALDL